MSPRIEPSHRTPAPAQAAALRAPIDKSSRFSSDFQSWLTAQGYGQFGFAQGDKPGFGGKTHPDQKLRHQPVIFVHGNSDSAASWHESIRHFLDQGYRPSEIYALTWGPSDPRLFSQQTHSRAYVQEVRAFIEAVMRYTGAKHVDVVGHSMGVTLARQAIKGGTAYDPTDGGSYDVGAPLGGKVDTFVGVAGANHGLAVCGAVGDAVPACNIATGLHPLSRFLRGLNSAQHFEGKHVYSIWSVADNVIGPGLAVYTSPVPGQDGQKVSLTDDHLGVRDHSPQVQLAMVRDHQTEPAAAHA